MDDFSHLSSRIHSLIYFDLPMMRATITNGVEKFCEGVGELGEKIDVLQNAIDSQESQNPVLVELLVAIRELIAQNQTIIEHLMEQNNGAKQAKTKPVQSETSRTIVTVVEGSDNSAEEYTNKKPKTLGSVIPFVRNPKWAQRIKESA